MMSESKLTTVIPQLPSSNLAQTRDFMTRVLGFECLADYGEMAIFKKDATELHYWLCQDSQLARTLAKESSCYFRVENINELFRVFQSAGARFGYELEPKPWGMNEMQVNDPDGNALRFGESID